MSKCAAQSERLWLRSLESEADVDEYLEELHRIATNKLAIFYSGRAFPTKIEMTKERVMGRIPTPESPWRRSYAILLRPTLHHSEARAPLIGMMELPREAPGRGYEIAYGLHPDYWGKGYASEALKLFLDLHWAVKREEGQDILIAKVEPVNLPSSRLVEKAGFKKGEFVAASFRRGSDGPDEKMRDLQVWYLEQPVKSNPWSFADFAHDDVTARD